MGTLVLCCTCGTTNVGNAITGTSYRPDTHCACGTTTRRNDGMHCNPEGVAEHRQGWRCEAPKPLFVADKKEEPPQGVAFER